MVLVVTMAKETSIYNEFYSFLSICYDHSLTPQGILAIGWNDPNLLPYQSWFVKSDQISK